MTDGFSALPASPRDVRFSAAGRRSHRRRSEHGLALAAHERHMDFTHEVGFTQELLLQVMSELFDSVDVTTMDNDVSVGLRRPRARVGRAAAGTVLRWADPAVRERPIGIAASSQSHDDDVRQGQRPQDDRCSGTAGGARSPAEGTLKSSYSWRPLSSSVGWIASAKDCGWYLITHARVARDDAA